MSRHEADYIDRTIEMVRIHRDADNCWPQWANIFADEIEDLRADRDRLAEALRRIADGTWTPTTGDSISPREYARAALADTEQP